MSAPWWLLFFIQTETATVATVQTSTVGMSAEDVALARYLDVLKDLTLLESLSTVEDLVLLEVTAEAAP